MTAGIPLSSSKWCEETRVESAVDWSLRGRRRRRRRRRRTRRRRRSRLLLLTAPAKSIRDARNPHDDKGHCGSMMIKELASPLHDSRPHQVASGKREAPSPAGTSSSKNSTFPGFMSTRVTRSTSLERDPSGPRRNSGRGMGLESRRDLGK